MLPPLFCFASLNKTKQGGLRKICQSFCPKGRFFLKTNILYNKFLILEELIFPGLIFPGSAGPPILFRIKVYLFLKSCLGESHQQ